MKQIEKNLREQMELLAAMSKRSLCGADEICKLSRAMVEIANHLANAQNLYLACQPDKYTILTAQEKPSQVD